MVVLLRYFSSRFRRYDDQEKAADRPDVDIEVPIVGELFFSDCCEAILVVSAFGEAVEMFLQIEEMAENERVFGRARLGVESIYVHGADQ